MGDRVDKGCSKFISATPRLDLQLLMPQMGSLNYGLSLIHESAEIRCLRIVRFKQLRIPLYDEAQSSNNLLPSLKGINIHKAMRYLLYERVGDGKAYCSGTGMRRDKRGIIEHTRLSMLHCL